MQPTEAPLVETPEYQQAVADHYRRKAYRRQQRQRLRTRLNILPALKTDATFMRGSHVDDGFGNDEASRRIAYQKAAAAGMTPSGRYMSQLADELGDPKAWVNTRDEVKHICEQRGYSCTGAVDVKAREPDGPDPFDEPYMVADDIVEEAVKKELGDETVGQQERDDLWHKTREKFSGRP